MVEGEREVWLEILRREDLRWEMVEEVKDWGDQGGSLGFGVGRISMARRSSIGMRTCVEKQLGCGIDSLYFFLITTSCSHFVTHSVHSRLA